VWRECCALCEACHRVWLGSHAHTAVSPFTTGHDQQAGSVQQSLKPAAIGSIVVYTVGLPLAFLLILVRHRHAIQADQALRVANEGNTEATNPHFYIRLRYQELYSMFQPEFYWWRLVLTLRKLCEVAIALMLSSKPLFQAWYVACWCREECV
jgi:hypothetical protein